MAASQHIKQQVTAYLQALAVIHGRPEWWNDDGSTNKGAIGADFNTIYGGWVLTECCSISGGETLGPLGFPRHRVGSQHFLELLEVATYIKHP